MPCLDSGLARYPQQADTERPGWAMFAAHKSVVLSLLLSLSAAATPPPASAVSSPPSCQSAAPGQLVPDPEFDPYTLTATWQENPVHDSEGNLLAKGKVFIAPVDRRTGVILTRSATIFSDADPVDWHITENGPEWGCSQNKCAVYFTSYMPDRSNGRLVKLVRTQNGLWHKIQLAQGEQKISPIVSQDFASSGPPMVYYARSERFHENALTTSNFGWRSDERPVVDYSMPRRPGRVSTCSTIREIAWVRSHGLRRSTRERLPF